ncbi:DNA phosphorothioation system sulfurtransferase DndC [Maridesulfovibrio sp.]|uniref:DNA phosphorothioation system sulfurtransferase DndC n=1 Tax=Maridesulfovibrio sp. TaxID=2795000 RepID=UPI002AA6DB89|nr:DNA phosphorothioation system sulfurtransferase DndC [Maridesulfovibrio sp.]
MTTCTSTNITDEATADEKWKAIVAEIKDEYLSTDQSHPWIIGFSGGKDSTLLAHAVFDALLDIPPFKRTRPVHIVSNDTLVESPLVISHLDQTTQRISEAVEALGLPISVVRTKPEIDKTFWVLLIGKGYPSPNQTMRWCTDRLKVLPTSTYIKNHVSEHGAAIVVLGVRKDESQSRLRSINKHRNLKGERLSPHDKLKGAFIYRPIVDLTTCDVWELLLMYDAPWGGNHSALVKLYKDSEGGECPVVLTADDAPACGSRFGCWTCTVVEKDKSLQGFVDSGLKEYEPLIEFRGWLKEIRNDPEMRQALRRNGKLTFGATGSHVPGPFTINARRQILERLLIVQKQFGEELISEEEIELIHKHWSKELQQGKGIANG